MINHAILDVEMDAFRGRLVDEKYLNPLIWSTRSLREMINLQDDNISMLKRIRDKLITDGWRINDDGELVKFDGTTAESSSNDNLPGFLKGLRVSVDSDGSPKYLVDSKGKRLPINLKWLPVLERQADEHIRRNSRSSWRFNIVISEESLSDTSAAGIGGQRRATEGEKEGEGLGLDLDYLGSEIEDDDDDEDHGRLVFKTKDHHKFEDDDQEYFDNNM